MISPTFALKRHVTEASAQRNVIFSHRFWLMSSESTHSTFVFANASAIAWMRADFDPSRSPKRIRFSGSPW